MLAAFRFVNFRSFRYEVVLSLRAHRPDKSLQSSLLRPTTNSRVLPVAAIYGANAAGKTNVLAALRYMAQVVRHSQTKFEPSSGTQLEPHLNAQDEPSEFEAEFFADGQRYVYGFKATTAEFLEEWLYSFPKGRQALVFRRVSADETAEVSFGSTLKGEHRFVDSTSKRTRPNSLYLSAAAQDNNPIAGTIQDFFKGIFHGSLEKRVDEPMADFTSTASSEIPPLRELMMVLLKSADNSIEDIEIETDEGQSWGELKPDAREGFFRRGKRRYRVNFIYGSEKNRFAIPLEQQSNGIKKLYQVAGEVVASLVRTEVMLFDEIESSIHPHVARLIVDLFQDKSVNQHGSQLIFSTHDTGLLDQSLLRRDQIWFVEKDRLCSRLYSLLEFSPRKDANLEAGYLRGRYGAIPVARPRSSWIVESASTQQSAHLEQESWVANDG